MSSKVSHIHSDDCSDHDDHSEDDGPVQQAWYTTVSPKKAADISLTGVELHITSAALTSSSGSAVVSIKTAAGEDKPAVVCTLGGERGPLQQLLDLSFFSDDDALTITVEGTSSVSFVGSVALFQMMPPDSGDEEDEEEGGRLGRLQEEDGEDDDEDDEDVGDEEDDEGEEEEEEEDGDDIAVVTGAKKSAPAPEGKPAVSVSVASVSTGLEGSTKMLSAVERLKRKRDEGASGSAPDASAAAADGGAKKAKGGAASLAAVGLGRAGDEAPEGLPVSILKKKKGETAIVAPALAAKPAVAAVPAAAASKPASSSPAPAAAASSSSKKEEKKADKFVAVVPKKLMYSESAPGLGPALAKGQKASVTYVGSLSNGKVFDKGTISFRVGKGEVIKGWDMGVVGMRVGCMRKLIIHPDLAYGARGSPPEIPPEATLTFNVELRKIQ